MNAEPLSPETSPEPPAEEKYPFWNYQDLVLLVGLSVPAMVGAALVVRLAEFLLPAENIAPAAAVLAAQFLAYAVWFVFLWAIIKLRYGKSFWPSMAWISPRRGIGRFAVYGPLLALAVAVTGAVLKTPEIQMPMMELLRDRTSLLLIGIFAVTLGPLCEELAFRGFFLPLLARSLGPAAAILITAAVFASLHGPQYGWSWRHLLLVGTAGAAFGVARWRTGSTSAAIVMHATYNLTFFVGYLTHLEEIGAPW